MDNKKSKFLMKEELEKRLEWYESKYGPYVVKRGFHNWKNLFKKPTFQDWLILIMLIIGLFIGWAYNHDTKECRDFLATFEDKACEICNIQIERAVNQQKNNPPQTITFNVNEENPLLGET